jgi:hypothetical protein
MWFPRLRDSPGTELKRRTQITSERPADRGGRLKSFSRNFSAKCPSKASTTQRRLQRRQLSYLGAEDDAQLMAAQERSKRAETVVRKREDSREARSYWEHSSGCSKNVLMQWTGRPYFNRQRPNLNLAVAGFAFATLICSAMKLLTEYLERALNLERLADGEQDQRFRDDLLSQAAAYRRLAAKRAKEYGLPAPSPPETRTSE